MSFVEQCPDDIYQKTILLTPEDTDRWGNMTPAALTRYSGECAVEHMERQQLLSGCLASRGLLWMIGWSCSEILRPPHLGEMVILWAWAGIKKSGMYPRRCALYTPEGALLARNCTLWLTVDRKTRRMDTLADVPITMAPITLEDDLKPPKLSQRFPCELPFQGTHTVQAEEIDFNGHCNNACYLRWAEELLSDTYHRSHSCRGIWVQYARELRAGETVDLTYTLEEDVLWLSGTLKGEDCFRLRLEYGAALP